MTESEGIKPRLCEHFSARYSGLRFVVTACIGLFAVCKGNSIFVIEDLLTFFTIHPLLCFHAVPSFFRIYMLCNKTLEQVTDHYVIFFVIGQFAWFADQNCSFPLIAMNLTEKERKKNQNGIFCCSWSSMQGRMPLSSVFVVYFFAAWKYSSETKGKSTISYRFLYCLGTLSSFACFPMAGACATCSCRPEVRRNALLPSLHSVTVLMSA